MHIKFSLLIQLYYLFSALALNRARVRDTSRVKFEFGVGSAVRAGAGAAVRPSTVVGAGTGAAVEAGTGAAVGAGTVAAVEAAIGAGVRAGAGAATGTAVGARTAVTTGAEVAARFRTIVRLVSGIDKRQGVFILVSAIVAYFWVKGIYNRIIKNNNV